MAKKTAQPISWKRKERRGVKVKKPIPWGKLIRSFFVKLRLLIGLSAMSLLIASPYLAWRYLEENPVFKIERVVVKSKVKYLSANDIQQLTKSALQQNFVSFDVAQYRDDISRFPWIKSVSVTRHWFSELEVDIEERIPIAVLNGGKLVDVNGNLYDSAGIKVDGLVDLLVDENNLPKVLEYKDKIVSMMKLININLEAISLDYRGSWSLFFHNRVEIILGTDDIEERLKTFVNHYKESIEEKIDNIISIDFRYNHGYAVKWKDK